jgi:heme oxygenase (biliverdin-IX-beta and delta-forming)
LELIAKRLISESLKEATRIPHAALEKSMVERLRQTDTPAAYAGLLRIFYGFYKPLEQLIDQFIDKDHLPDYERRRKSAAIINDLEQLGDARVGKLSNYLPVITNNSQAFGALYVLEGSTLGGRIICNMLKKNVRLDNPGEQVSVPANAFSFFEGYGEATGQMWTTFKTKLDNYAADEARKLEIIDAATATFVNFKKWMIDNG